MKLTVARHIIADNPATAVKLVGKHYVGFFCAGSAGTGEARGPDVNAEARTADDAASKLIGIAYIVVGLLFGLVKIFYVALGFASLRWRDIWSSIDSIGATMLLCAVGLNLMVAMFSVPIPRFLMASLPLVMIACLCAGTTIIDRLLRHSAVR